MTSVPTTRILALESVRGLASAAVVVSHIIMAFAYPNLTGRPAQIETLPSFQQLSLELIYRPIRDGQFAVMVFFVLSGVVLSQSFLHRGRFSDIIEAIVRRYPRLAIPAVASACIPCFLWQAGLMHNADAAQQLIDKGIPSDWLDHFDQPNPTYAAAIRQSAYEIFFAKDPPLSSLTYNSVLWTMRSELYGSLLVFGIVGLFGKSSRIAIIAFAITVFLAGIGQTRMALFPAGIALAALRRDRPSASLPTAATLVMILAAFYLCGAYRIGDFKPKQIWDGGFGYLIVEQVCGIAAILTVAVVLFSPPISKLLEAKPYVWLGKISFGLYLIHLPILMSLGAWVFLNWYPSSSHATSMVVTGIVVVLVSLPSAWLLFQFVDRPAVWFSKKLSRFLVRRSHS